MAKVLRQSGRPVLVAANKVDSARAEAAASEAFALGFPTSFRSPPATSRGVNDLLDMVVARLPKTARVPGKPSEGPRKAQ